VFTDAIVSILNITTEFLVLLGISTLLLAVEPAGTLIAVLVLGAAAWTFHRSTRARILRWGESRQLHDGLRLQHLQQGLGGAKDVKLLGREANFLDQYFVHSAKSARASQFQATLQMLPRLWLELLAVVGLATLVISMLAQGREMATIVPTLGLFAAAAFTSCRRRTAGSRHPGARSWRGGELNSQG
jgi:ABC-type transport system involved in cytochrome bd biosynthesis fused ATPase/permease subunit